MSLLNYLPGRQIDIFLPNDERHKAVFAIAELDDVIASHNEYNFAPTKNYPVDASGQNINDRAYDRDPAAQAEVKHIAQNLQPERLINTSRDAEGTPIVTQSGIVISGNNRTMSIKLAASEYPEKYKQYVDFLKEELPAFGISETAFQARNFNRPVIVRVDFNITNPTTADLAKFNKDTKKAVRPIDRAIALRKILSGNERCISIISSIVGNYETFSEFRANFSDEKKMRDTLLDCNIIIRQEMNNYWQENGFSDSGMELLENMIAGLVLEPDAIIAADEPGVRRFRNIIITSLPVLIKNNSLPEPYRLTRWINEAIIIENKIVQSGLSFTDYIAQIPLHESRHEIKSVYMNRLLKRGRNAFKDNIERYNNSAERQGTAMLWDDVITPEEMFQKYIIDEIIPAEREIIEKYYSPSEKMDGSDSRQEQSNIEALESEYAEWCRLNPFCTKGQMGKKKKELYKKHGIDEYRATKNNIHTLIRMLSHQPAMAAADGGQLLPVTYYSSAYAPMTWAQMRETEVTERNNYTTKQFERFQKKYLINDNDNVIWVSPDKNVAVSYAALADDRDAVLSMTAEELEQFMDDNDIYLNEYSSNSGALITESNDGDEGFIFLITNQKMKRGGVVQYKIPEQEPLLLKEPGEQPRLDFPEFPKESVFLPDNSIRKEKKKPALQPNVGQIGIYYFPKKVIPETKILSSRNAFKFLVDHCYDYKTFEMQETFWLLFLNRANVIIGYHELSKGSVTGTIVDLKLLTALASEMLASGVIVSHNHPSSNLQPSEEDKKVTSKIQEALKLIECTLLDHIIVAKRRTNPSGTMITSVSFDYISFNDEGFLSYEDGGKVKLEKGGIVKGKLHSDGGEKFKLKGTDTVVELEADEGVINRRSMLSKQKMTVSGTPCEIASKINQVGGGVKFNC